MADLDVLAKALPPLPETADELRAVAKSLGAGEADLKLGSAATVTAVKQTKLDQYRIVYFATHALVLGETEQVVMGLAEPALVLSLPATATALDDGLLTSSEVAQLKLNADWVVLSACNTAAAEKPGAEALSGLARALHSAQSTLKHRISVADKLRIRDASQPRTESLIARNTRDGEPLPRLK